MSDEDEKVGYKRPPKKHRFKKGNKAAAKRNPDPVTEEEALPNLMKTLNAPVQVRGKDGKDTEMEAFEAQLRKLVRLAIGEKNPQALRYVLNLILEHKIHTPPQPTKMYGCLVVPGRYTRESWERLFSKESGPDHDKG